MNLRVWNVLLLLQAAQVAFLWLHDWIPLPPFTDVAALKATEPLWKRLLGTLFNGVPFTILLVQSVRYRHAPALPHTLLVWLFIGYGFLFFGELMSWWVPYLLRPDPALAERYTVLFGRTHAFLPMSNGIVPNTAHVLLHTCTVLTLLLLIVVAVR